MALEQGQPNLLFVRRTAKAPMDGVAKAFDVGRVHGIKPRLRPSRWQAVYRAFC